MIRIRVYDPRSLGSWFKLMLITALGWLRRLLTSELWLMLIVIVVSIELCSSIMRSLIQTPSSSPTPSTSMGGRMTPLPESGRYTPVTSTPVKDRGARESGVGSVERKSQTVPRRRISTESRTLALEKEKKTQRQSSPQRTTGSMGRKTSQMTAVHGGQQMFVPPAAPPKKANWMPDQQVSMCVICREIFSMVGPRTLCASYSKVSWVGWSEI